MTPHTDPGPRRRFVLLRTLGEGSFGSVFLADMEGAGGFRRRVALKLLNRTWDPGSDAGRRLRDEARLLGRLQHRHIVRVDDLVRVNGQWALILEYVGGADLETVFAQARQRGIRIPPRAVAEIGAAVASALDAAWSAVDDAGAPLRVIHRDIKPSNVRLAENGDLKVLDFGVARADFTGREARTESIRYGSLGYMPPERLLSAAETPASDLYALGVVLYELLTLDTFGRSELTPEPQAAQVARAQAAIEQAVGDESGTLTDLIGRLLAFDPQARPNAAQVEAELRAASRVLSGEDLLSFSRMMLPRLGVSAPTAGDPVEGTVLEETSAILESMLAPPPPPTRATTTPGVEPPRSSGTIVLPDDAIEPVPEPARPAAWKWGLGVAALLLVAAAAVVTTRDPEASPPEPPAAEVAEAPTGAAEEILAAPAPEGSTGDPPPPAEPVALPAGLPAQALSAASGPADALASAAATRRLPKGTSSSAPPPTPADPADPAPPAGEPAATTTATATRVRAAKFSITGAEGIAVTCGDVRASGTTNALLREFPAGACSVAAGGRSTTITVDAPRGVACAVEGDLLTCR